MNTSQFMDKQIMDLSNSQRNNDFIDLIKPEEDRDDDGGGGKTEGIVPSYDFQPIRPLAPSQPPNFDSSNGGGGTRVWNSADSMTNNASGAGGIRNYGSLESNEPAKVIIEKDHYGCDATLVSEIDRTMKKHADNLLHALEGVSARLSQLESRTRHLENSVDDLKESVGNNNGSIDGKMRQFENLLREVQADVNVIRDKQDIMEAQFQLAKLQVSNKVEKQPEVPNTVHVDSMHQAASAPQQPHQLLPPVAILPPSGLSPPNALPPQQNLSSGIQLQNQFPPNQFPPVPQQDPYFPTPGQTQDVTNQQFLLTAPPPQQQHQHQLPPPTLAPQQQYQPPPHQQYSQSPPPPQQHPSLSMVSSPRTQPPLGHLPEEMQYVPPQNYPPSLRQPQSHPPSGPPPSQQFHGTPAHLFEPQSSIHGSGFSSAYGHPSGSSEQYPYGGSPSRYGGGGGGSGSTMKPLQQSSGSGYPQLPTARILPQALPTASGVNSGSGSAGSGNRVPLDDVIDKVTTMGFSRDQVRATVRKLTENGQSVDLNVVLDKLMNDGGEGQQQRPWFGR